MEFLGYTSKMRELLMLMELEASSNKTQYELSKVSNIVSSMVNNYIKRFVNSGYIEKTGNNRNTQYILTSKGKEYKNYLLVSYLSELMDNIKYSEGYLRKTLESLIGQDECRLFLYGAGEAGKVCLKILRNIKTISIVGFIDDDTVKTNKRLEGYQIFSMEEAIKMEYDKIIVTTFQNAHGIAERLYLHVEKPNVLVLG